MAGYVEKFRIKNSEIECNAGTPFVKVFTVRDLDLLIKELEHENNINKRLNKTFYSLGLKVAINKLKELKELKNEG